MIMQIMKIFNKYRLKKKIPTLYNMEIRRLWEMRPKYKNSNR